jgi:peptidyl-prolyl cis-trans isomerase SurA
MGGAYFNSRRFGVGRFALFVVLSVGARGQVQVMAAPTPPLPVASAPSGLRGPLISLDHVVAVVNGDVILESDVQEEMRFAVLQPERADPAGNTPQSALARLIDRDLILQQMKISQADVPSPTAQQLDGRLAEMRKQIPDCAQYRCETEAGWQAFLAARGLTEAEVRAHWRERMIILSFIQSRFGAGVHITQAEIEQYYNQDFAPEFAKRKLHPPPLTTVSSRIQEILLQQRVNGFLRDWLQSLKDDGSVSILSAAYNQVGSAQDDAVISGGQR